MSLSSIVFKQESRIPNVPHGSCHGMDRLPDRTTPAHKLIRFHPPNYTWWLFLIPFLSVTPAKCRQQMLLHYFFLYHRGCCLWSFHAYFSLPSCSFNSGYPPDQFDRGASPSNQASNQLTNQRKYNQPCPDSNRPCSLSLLSCSASSFFHFTPLFTLFTPFSLAHIRTCSLFLSFISLCHSRFLFPFSFLSLSFFINPLFSFFHNHEQENGEIGQEPAFFWADVTQLSKHESMKGQRNSNNISNSKK
ncbi:hypothetical protein K457DRAFT_697041 [Linnemannia elongata AG-77]|uniref:Uncharacterized protein n=1 Tax=Linnemannia elongata AG-77 TaxID=1314771 RepID=A0A197JMQ9_9FUNG|nr:hypothetical protein K457DRAFT_697041 [Linnemannia elongata AG-77]